MPTVEWKIKGATHEGTLAALGISGLIRKRTNGVMHTVTFDAPGAAFDGTPLFTYREPVTIYRGNDIFFSGLCLTVPCSADGASEQISYEIGGPWWYLERTIYEQSWALWNAAALPPHLANAYKSRVILSQAADGSSITTGAQIVDAVNFAISKGAAMQLGTVDGAIQLPWEECTDILCSEVIAKMLRCCPDTVCDFDYSTTPPTFNCRARANMSAVSYPVTSGAPASGVSVTPRHDLKIPGVVVRFEISGAGTGESYEAIDVQTAGLTTDWETLKVTIQLAGASITWLTQRIKTEDWPEDADLDDVTWCRAHFPWLDEALKTTDAGGNPKAHIVLHLGAGSLVAAGRSGALELPRFITEGTIQDWMLEGPFNIVVEDETFTLHASYEIWDAAGNFVETVMNQELLLKVVSTDAETKTYRRVDDEESGESAPAGLAAALFAAWGQLYYDGTFKITEEECSGTVSPGNILHLTGGRAGWATMVAIVQDVTEDVDKGETTITFGPPKHLGPEDLVTLLRGFRTRKSAIHYQARQTGESADVAGSVSLGGTSAKNEVGKGIAEVAKQTFRATGSTYTKTIKADPTDITKEDANVDIKARELDVCVDGVAKKMWVMCSAPYVPPA